VRDRADDPREWAQAINAVLGKAAQPHRTARGGDADIIRMPMGGVPRLVCWLMSAAAASALAACAGARPVTHTSVATHSTVLAAPQPEPHGWKDPDTSARIVVATQLVTEDAVWNRVTIHADGGGNVAQWTGETSPIHYFAFRLPGSVLARVRSLVSRPSARALRAQTFSTAPNALVYTILLHGRLVRVPDAPARTALGPLVAIFDHLISSYS
jgi:hypothetical protein